jgi:hypothetical protein
LEVLAAQPVIRPTDHERNHKTAISTAPICCCICGEPAM